jgi:peptidoglycan/LPS O-acetylase OafA/YrhL
MKYRPELDGLRAISVIAVLLFHAGFKFFSGGFIGVDVFFVISGYLITYISLEEHRRGNFSIQHFYEKRIRRLFPALICVLLATVFFAYRLLLPYELKYYFQSLVSTVLFSSNIFFYMKSGYFDASNDIKPLLHNWSLSVEEQFYFVFPLLILFFARKKYLLKILIALLFLSLGVVFIKDNAGSSASFYLLHARAWELLAGSVLAFVHFKEYKLGFLDEMPALPALVAILFSFHYFDEKTLHPGPWTLLPVLSTLVIINSRNVDSSVNRLLSYRLFVKIGLISYSLYLVHQPVFVFERLFLGRVLSLWESLIGLV